jgi:GrpB-like predicted nucleotidyltransferase (UPF0157 family)
MTLDAHARIARVSKIEIVDPRPDWPDEFLRIAGLLREVLGVGADAIQHIGSTAVDGLPAKDIIDVQVSVADLDDERLRTAMESAGFRWAHDIDRDHLPPGSTVAQEQLHKHLAWEGAGMRRANIHFRVPGRFNHRYAMLCRDYLRTHPGAAAAYGAIKRNLARLFPDDPDAYYDVKDPVFDLIMAGAEDWALAVAWSPPGPPPPAPLRT